MQRRRTYLTATILFAFGLTLVLNAEEQPIKTVDFNDAPAFTDFATYIEDGLKIIPSVGEVRINDFVSSGNNAAQPSFGFGQGLDSSFLIKHNLNLRFSLVSIDLLEATLFPDVFGVTVIGTRADSSTETQTFTLDGVAGAQTFVFSPGFTNLTSLEIVHDHANAFDTDIVMIDNLRFTVAPGQLDPATLDVALYTGIRVTGTVGGTYRIESAPADSGTDWTALTNLVLTTSPQLYIDPEPVTTSGGKIYRALAIE